MSLKVLKFGGSSLADAAHFRQVADIVKAEPERRYVVASAPGKRMSGDTKVTDLLYKCYELSVNEEDVTEVLEEIKTRYNDIINDLGIDLDLTEAFEKIRLSLLHNTGRDYIASRGEYLNAMVLAKYLGFDFIDAKKVIFFKENGAFDSERTNDVLRDCLAKHEYAVIPGFYGSMPNGTIKTFSRGGSDITGSIVARAASATLYENWTDVSGFLMADPKCLFIQTQQMFTQHNEILLLYYECCVLIPCFQSASTAGCRQRPCRGLVLPRISSCVPMVILDVTRRLPRIVSRRR